MKWTGSFFLSLCLFSSSFVCGSEIGIPNQSGAEVFSFREVLLQDPRYLEQLERARIRFGDQAKWAFLYRRAIQFGDTIPRLRTRDFGDAIEITNFGRELAARIHRRTVTVCRVIPSLLYGVLSL